MYEKHPEYKKNRSFNFFSKLAKHEHSSSESSLEKYDFEHRKKIIERWNKNYFIEKRRKEQERKNDQARIDLAILQQKLKETKNYDEDIKFSNLDKEYYADSEEERKERNKYNKYIYQRSRERIKNGDDYGDSDETISKNDL